jgi:hypothetical protein
MLARLLLTLMLLISAPAHADEAAAWAALGEGGQIALMRHAVTVPGIGDPPGFRLGDCATQRLLSDTGREQAKAIGAALRERGVSADRVLSSAWCRCVDTAELMDVGPVEIFEPLNSFFNSGDAEHEETGAIWQKKGRFESGLESREETPNKGDAAIACCDAKINDCARCCNIEATIPRPKGAVSLQCVAKLRHWPRGSGKSG